MPHTPEGPGRHGDETRLVCHFIDESLGSPYFRSLVGHHDRARFGLLIGSIAPPGSLQQSMAELSTPSFSLGAVSRRDYPTATITLARLLRRERVSVLHAHCFDPTLVGLLASRLARIPFVFTRHHSDHAIRLGKRWHTRIDSWCARHADQVIAVSEATRRIMVEIEGVPDALIRVIPNGVEPLPEPPPEQVDRLRSELGLGPGRVCLVPARLHDEKGHRVLFDALPAVHQKLGAPLTALLAGTGPHREQLEAEAAARGLGASVRFLGYRRDMPALMALASVVVLPSLAESFGIALVEAMSLGKPIVATSVGGIPEVVVSGESGLLVPPGDSTALAQALFEILGNAEKAEALGAAGRRRAPLFAFDRMMRGYEEIYARLAGVA